MADSLPALLFPAFEIEDAQCRARRAVHEEQTVAVPGPGDQGSPLGRQLVDVCERVRRRVVAAQIMARVLSRLRTTAGQLNKLARFADKVRDRDARRARRVERREAN